MVFVASPEKSAINIISQLVSVCQKQRSAVVPNKQSLSSIARDLAEFFVILCGLDGEKILDSRVWKK